MVLPPQSSLAEELIAEGPAFSGFARIFGLLDSLFIPPLFLWVWLDDPMFLKAPNPLQGTVFMGLVTLGMLFLAVFGLLAYFARTRVTRRQIEWGIFRRHQLPIDEIDEVVKVHSWRIMNLVYVVTVLQLVTRQGRRIEITGGTPALEEAFYELETRFSW